MMMVGVSSLIFLALASSSLTTSSNWSCDFDRDGEFYKCIVVNKFIDIFEKRHFGNKSNDDVNQVLTSRFIPSDLFKLLPNVDNYEMSYSKIDKLTEEQFEEKALKLHTFTSNKGIIREIGANAFAFGPNLESIDLRSNSVKIVDKDAFRGLTKLKSLYLGWNFISELDENIFQDLINLKSVHLSDNRLTTLDENLFKNNQELRYVTISDNQLQNIPAQTILNLPEDCFIFLKRSGCVNGSIKVPADFDSNHPFIESVVRNCSSTH